LNIGVFQTLVKPDKRQKQKFPSHSILNVFSAALARAASPGWNDLFFILFR